MENPEENEPNAYDYIEACYIANDIPLELLEEVWPTAEFLVNAVVAYTQPTETYDDQSEYDQVGEHVSDEEPEDDEEPEANEENEIEEQPEEINDGLEIDRILTEEIKRLNLSRQTRRKNRRKHNNERNNILLAGLIQESNAVVPTTSSDTSYQVNLDPSIYNPAFSDSFSIIARISDSIPESSDDMDDYRLANSMYVNVKTLEHNRELSWKVDALGKCLKRALNELCLFRIALQNTVGDLRNEIELLRKNTLGTIKRIIQGDITRREEMQRNWEEVQNFIRRKNKRITELTDQLNGTDLEVGFLLASHKERIESACIAERNFFRISERLEDLELELKKKRCTHCESNQELASAQDKLEQEEFMRRREEKRKQIEENERMQIANAERYGKVIQNHIASTILDLKNSTLPWHGPDKQQQNGQPIPVLHQRVAQAPNAGPQQKPPELYQPGFVPYEVYHITRLRAEELERNMQKQERMNEILSRDLTGCKTNLTKMKTDHLELQEENKKLLAELSKIKSTQQFYRKNGRQNTAEGLETPPDSNASDKSKDDHLNLPKPPSPPELFDKLINKSAKNSPVINDLAISNKRKLIENNDRKIPPRNPFLNPIKAELGNHNIRPSLNPNKEPPFIKRPMDHPNSLLSTEKRYFSPPKRQRPDASPDPKRPAFAPPSLLPPRPLFQREQPCRPDRGPQSGRDNSFFDDSLANQASFRSFSPDYRRRDVSPPSPQFEPMQQRPFRILESTSTVQTAAYKQLARPGNEFKAPGPPPLMNTRQMYGNEMRPSFRPPAISPPDRQMRQPPWHNAPMMPMRPQIRSTTGSSWTKNSTSFHRR
ncbi:hypothetical protein M3Y97_00584700 [Aphelenchoides bicaudatus]|nr:hypothetical protein M3Y97_00584700 [Aphelenchoides bicaudatus]